jgi:short-subunit dehydrogenase
MQPYPWKHVWITGASSGIGRELAVALSRAGVNVSVSARSVDALETLAKAYSSIEAYPLDVTEPEHMVRAIAEIESERGPIDLAVLNAGFWELSDSSKLDVDLFGRSIDVNYMGVVRCLVPLTSAMAGRGTGHVAVVASVAGYRGLPKSAYYGPTKAALINLCESLQPDLMRQGVKVQIINPGFVRTPMTERNDFPMPFLMETATAVEHTLRGLTSNRFEIAFPWQLIALLKATRILPIGLYLWLIKTFVTKK